MQRVQKIIVKDGDKIMEKTVPSIVMRTPFNSKFFKKNLQVFTLPSRTVPDEAMTVYELVKRFAHGLPLSLGKEPIYDGDEETTDLDRLDLAERQQILNAAREEMDAINARVAKRRLDAQNKKLDAMVEQRVQEKLKALPIKPVTESDTPKEA